MSEEFREAVGDVAVCGQPMIAVVHTMKNEGKLQICGRRTWRDGERCPRFCAGRRNLCWTKCFGTIAGGGGNGAIIHFAGNDGAGLISETKRGSTRESDFHAFRR